MVHIKLVLLFRNILYLLLEKNVQAENLDSGILHPASNPFIERLSILFYMYPHYKTEPELTNVAPDPNSKQNKEVDPILTWYNT